MEQPKRSRVSARVEQAVGAAGRAKLHVGEALIATGRADRRSSKTEKMAAKRTRAFLASSGIDAAMLKGSSFRLKPVHEFLSKMPPADASCVKLGILPKLHTCLRIFGSMLKICQHDGGIADQLQNPFEQ